MAWPAWPALYLVLGNRSVFVTTEAELKLIASAANTGKNSKPVNGNNAPASQRRRRRIGVGSKITRL